MTRLHVTARAIAALATMTLVTPLASAATAPSTDHPMSINLDALPRGTDTRTKSELLLEEQMRAHPNLPPLAFWDAVAQCETAREWDRGHDWGPRARSWVSGGLGIAHSTWVGFGGRRFAPKAALATKAEQIIIANRVAFLGHQTNEFRTWEDRVAGRRHFRPGVGFRQGWGGTCRSWWQREHKWVWKPARARSASAPHPPVGS